MATPGSLSSAPGSPRRIVEPPGVRGCDTETYRGFVKLLATSSGRFIETRETEALLQWLWTECRKTHNVFWNVAYDLQCIMKPWVIHQGGELKQEWLALNEKRARLRDLIDRVNDLTPEEVLEKAALEAENLDRTIADHFIIHDELRVKYLRGKGFTITVGDLKHGVGVSFYDASAFFRPDHANISLDVAAKHHLGVGKNAEELGIDRAKIGNEAGYYERHRDDIIRYCIQDATLTAALQDLTIKSHAALHLPWPKHPWSKASVHKEYWKTVPEVIGESDHYKRVFAGSPWLAFWSEAYHGGIFLSRHLGRFEEGLDADINSAYPWVMTTLRSLMGAHAVKGTSREFDDADYQFYKVKVKPTPRVMDNSAADGLLRYHYGRDPRTLYMTGWDLKTLDMYGDDYEVTESLGIVCDPGAIYPFRYLKDVFDRKAKVKTEYGKKSVEYNNIKVFSNSGSGALAQRRPAPSRWTNLIFASHVTARVRHVIWSLVKECEDAGDNLISIKTDGITVEGTHARARLLARSSAELGGIEVEKVDWGVAFENGVYVISHPGDKEPTFRHRGLKPIVKMHRPGCAKTEGECRCKSLPLLDAVKTCPDPSLVVDRLQPLSMVRAIIQDRPEDIAVFEEDRHELRPAKAAMRNFDVPAFLLDTPLKTYFETGWTLDWGHHV